MHIRKSIIFIEGVEVFFKSRRSVLLQFVTKSSYSQSSASVRKRVKVAALSGLSFLVDSVAASQTEMATFKLKERKGF